MNECIRTAQQTMSPDEMLAVGSGMAIFGVWMLLILFICIVVVVAIVGLYVATAIPIYKMAKRAGVPHAWLAWVPIASMYVRLKLSKREFNIFNFIKFKDRDKAFECYLWIIGALVLLSALICVMMFIPFINFVAIGFYYVIIAIFPIVFGIFMWRVNYDILMTYGLKEHAMWVSVLYYWCPYFMIIMTYKIMNSDPVEDTEVCVQKTNNTPVEDTNGCDKKKNSEIAASFKGEFFYPVELNFFAQKLRMIEKTGLRMQYKGEQQLQNGLEVKLVKDITMASWGENITVTLTGYSNGTHIAIHSECSAPTQLIDWGENEKNVKELFKYFEYQMPGRP